MAESNQRGPYFPDVFVEGKPIFQVLKDPVAIFYSVQVALYKSQYNSDVVREAAENIYAAICGDDNEAQTICTAYNTATGLYDFVRDTTTVGCFWASLLKFVRSADEEDKKAEYFDHLVRRICELAAVLEKVRDPEETDDGTGTPVRKYDEMYFTHEEITNIFIRKDSKAELLRMNVLPDSGEYAEIVAAWKRVATSSLYNESFSSLLTEAMRMDAHSSAFACGFEYIRSCRVPTQPLAHCLRLFGSTYGIDIVCKGLLFDCKHRRASSQHPNQADRLISWLTSFHIGAVFVQRDIDKQVTLEGAGQGGGKQQTVLAAKTMGRRWCSHTSYTDLEDNDDELLMGILLNAFDNTDNYRVMQQNGIRCWLYSRLAVDALTTWSPWKKNIASNIFVDFAQCTRLAVFNFLHHIFVNEHVWKSTSMADVLGVHSVSSFDYAVLSNCGLCTAMLHSLWLKRQTHPFMYDSHKELHFGDDDAPFRTFAALEFLEYCADAALDAHSFQFMDDNDTAIADNQVLRTLHSDVIDLKMCAHKILTEGPDRVINTNDELRDMMDCIRSFESAGLSCALDAFANEKEEQKFSAGPLLTFARNNITNFDAVYQPNDILDAYNDENVWNGPLATVLCSKLLWYPHRCSDLFLGNDAYWGRYIEPTHEVGGDGDGDGSVAPAVFYPFFL